MPPIASTAVLYACLIVGTIANVQIVSSGTNGISRRGSDGKPDDSRHLTRTFDCSTRAAGYYADVQTNCQVFHYCQWDGRVFSTFTCPHGFQFSEEQETCVMQGSKCGGTTTNDITMHRATTTDSTKGQQLRDQIPATSPPTTSVSLDTDQSESQSRRVSRHAIWLSPAPTPTGHQLVNPSPFILPNFQLFPELAAQSRQDGMLHLLVQPQPVQPQQQVTQIIPNQSIPAVTTTLSQIQGSPSTADLTVAHTMSVSDRQGQLIAHQPIRTFIHPRPHLRPAQLPPPPPPPPPPSPQRGFPGPQLQFAPAQFVLEDSREQGNREQRFFNPAPPPQRQQFSPLGQGSRRGPFFTSSIRPQFSGEVFGDGGSFPSPSDDRLPGRPGSRQPQSNFIINPEDLTLINEIVFPGPPRGDPANTRSQQQQQHQMRPPSTTSQEFQPHQGQAQVTFPQRFPAESPGFQNFPRRPSFEPLNSPPPSFFPHQQFQQQQPPPPTSQFQETKRRPNTKPLSTETERPLMSSSGSQEENEQFQNNPLRVHIQEDPRESTETSGRGPTRFQPDRHRWQSGDFRGPPQPTPPSKRGPGFQNFASSAPAKDATEEFGIPPPTEDFGVKLIGSEEERESHRPFIQATTSRNMPRSRRPLAPPPPPPQLFNSAESAGSTPTSGENGNIFTQTENAPSSVDPNRHHQSSGQQEDNGSSEPHSRNQDHEETSTEPNASTDSSSEFFGPVNPAFVSSGETHQNGGQNQESKNHFRPESNLNEENADFRPGQPFAGQQTVEATSNERSPNDQRDNNGNSQEKMRIPFRDFDPFQDSQQQESPQDDPRFFGEFPPGPTFGPQSVDQLAPPDLPPFTIKPDTEHSFVGGEHRRPLRPISDAVSRDSPSSPTSSSSDFENSTENPTSQPESNETLKPTRKRPLRVRARTRKLTTTATTPTTDEPSVASSIREVDAAAAAAKKRGQANLSRNRIATTTSTTTPSTPHRRRKPLFSRKTTKPIPTSAEINDVASSSTLSSTTTTTEQRRPLVRKMITRGNTTRTVIRRRKLIGSTTKSPNSASSEDKFPAAVSHHTSGIRRDQLITSREQSRSKSARMQSKVDSSSMLDALESREHPVVTEIAETGSSEASVREHISPDEDAIEFKENPRERESAKSLKVAASKATTVTTTRASASASTTSLPPSTTDATTLTTTERPEVSTVSTTNFNASTSATIADKTTETSSATTTATTASSTPLATENVAEEHKQQPEAMAKLRSLLNRKFIIKQTTEKPE